MDQISRFATLSGFNQWPISVGREWLDRQLQNLESKIGRMTRFISGYKSALDLISQELWRLGWGNLHGTYCAPAYENCIEFHWKYRCTLHSIFASVK